MIIRVTEKVFVDSFKAYMETKRGTRHEVSPAFSENGIKALFAHLSAKQDYETIELNVAYLCFVYKEYETFEAIQQEYYEMELESFVDLKARTEVIVFDGGCIIAVM